MIDYNISHHAEDRVRNRISFLYIEKARIDREDAAICAVQGEYVTPIPIASLSCLMLGPGTSVTHRAISAMTDSNCLCIWCGEKLRSFYASGNTSGRSSKNLLLQAKYHQDQTLHMQVIRKMYEKRFPGLRVKGMSLEIMRGAEGLRMQELYKQMSKEYCVPWEARKYDVAEWDLQDDINRCLSVANVYFYHIVHSVILTLGYSPALGFIHTGLMESFVFDIADLYKSDLTIPAAFEFVSKGYSDYSDLRRLIRTKMYEQKIMEKLVKDISDLFDNADTDIIVSTQNLLWGKTTEAAGGKNYAFKA